MAQELHVDIRTGVYFVVKWVKNTDKHVGWAGAAVPVFADPETGAISQWKPS